MCKISQMISIPDRRRKDIGMEGEDIASLFLIRKGYKVIGRNYRRRWGEIDIIVEKANIVHFVEVKAVSRDQVADFSREMDYRPEELVHKTKLQKIARTATLWMEEQKDQREFQIDVVGVIMNEATRTARCRLFEQVLE